MKRYERGKRMMASQIPLRSQRAFWNRGIGHVLPALLVLLAATSLTVATPVPVTNAGFEADVLADGVWLPGSATGWAVTGSAGVFNPTAAQIPPAGAIEGMNTLYSNGGTASQTLTTTLTAWTQYTLTAQVGDRTDSNFPGYVMELGVQDGLTFVLLAQVTTSVIPVDGFLMTTLDLIVPIGHPNIGSPLAIRMRGLGGQVNFDDVRLDATPGTPTGAVFVGNPGFEAVPVSEGGWSPSIPSWTLEGGLCGTFNPHDTNHLTGGAIGDQAENR